jgi:hypothetical protein
MRREKKQPAHLLADSGSATDYGILGVSFACVNSKTMSQPACAGGSYMPTGRWIIVRTFNPPKFI